MKNRSAMLYLRRKKMCANQPCCPRRRYVAETSPVRYQMGNTLSHQRLEEGMTKWLEYCF